MKNAPDPDTCTGNNVCDANGACKLANAQACTGDASCASGHCADGVCCDAVCNGACEACAEPGSVGTCSAVKGAPRGTRPACASAGTACGSTCDGTHRPTCTYAPASAPCGSTCTSGIETDSLCDGNGACVTGTPHACPGNFACDGAARCKTACAADADCATGYTCDPTHQCKPLATCDGDHTVTLRDGSTKDCGAYKCEQSGTCKTKCTSVADCVAPAVCGSSGECTAPASSSGGGSAGGCAIASDDSAATSLPFLVALAAGLGRRRRNASRAR